MTGGHRRVGRAWPIGLAIVIASCTSGSALQTIEGGSTEPSPTATAPCAAGSVRAHGGRQGASGQAQGTVDFTNIGATDCILEGVPAGIQLIQADGTPLDVGVSPPQQPGGPPVVLPPGVPDAADIVVYWSNWCGQPPGPLTIRLDLGGGRGEVSAPFDGPPAYDYVPRCDQPSQGSTLRVVLPFERPATPTMPGSVPPGYTCEPTSTGPYPGDSVVCDPLSP